MLAAALPQTTDEVLAFHLHLDVLGLLIAIAVAYELGIRRLGPSLAPQGEPIVTRRQRILFYSGLGSLLLVSSWPIHDLGSGSLFVLHMWEHMVFGLIAPPLLLWGTPWWLIRFAVRPIMPVVRIVTKPIVALLLFNAVLGLIHVPAVVELMLRSELAHFALHALLLVTGIIMWWPVVAPLPELPQLSPPLKIGYLFLQSLVPTIPASFLTLGDSALYKIYEELPRVGGISAHTDQVLAGLSMKVIGGLIIWGVMAGIFFNWWAEEQRFDAADRAHSRQS
jgi:putative membrane protein